MPFFKREISFRRKQAATDEDVDRVPAADDDVPVERSESDEVLVRRADEAVDEHEEHDRQVEVVAVMPADQTAVVHGGDGAGRRPSMRSAPSPRRPASTMDETRDEPAEVVPFYKRELSFRRKSADRAAVVACR